MLITHLPKNVLWIIFSYIEKKYLFTIMPKVCENFAKQLRSQQFVLYLMADAAKNETDVYPISVCDDVDNIRTCNLGVVHQYKPVNLNTKSVDFTKYEHGYEININTVDILFWGYGTERIDRIEENKRRLMYMMGKEEQNGIDHCGCNNTYNCLQSGNSCWRLQIKLYTKNMNEIENMDFKQIQNLPRFDSPIERSLIKNSDTLFQKQCSGQDDLKVFFELISPVVIL